MGKYGTEARHNTANTGRVLVLLQLRSDGLDNNAARVLDLREHKNRFTESRYRGAQHQLGSATVARLADPDVL